MRVMPNWCHPLFSKFLKLNTILFCNFATKLDNRNKPTINYSDMKKRFAFKMFLKPGCEEEYAKRHAAIWPELKEMIKEQGVGNYSIYWDKDTNILFAYQECSKEGNSQDTENVDPITQRWWDMMADIMEVNADNSPVTIPLPELFHLD